MKLLIIEDEIQLLDAVAQYLQREGFVCDKAVNYFQAEDKLRIFEYDIVLLDITLPDGNGLNLFTIIKEQHPTTGVLIISARDSLEDKVNGLDLGADDYMTKPFHLAELNSRVNALIRRRNFQGQTELVYNEICLDTTGRQVKVNGHKLSLTRKEYDLLLYLITNKSRVLTKEAMAEHLWGDHIEMADNFDFIYTHIKNLRRKILAVGGNDYLQTVYGVGYKFGQP